MNLRAREGRATAQTPFGTGFAPPAAPPCEKDPRRPLLPAPVWSCSDRASSHTDKEDGNERVPVVRQRRTPDTTPPLHTVSGMGPAGKENVEGDREGVRVEAPRTPSVKLLWDGRATEAVLELLRTTRVGCLGEETVPPGGGGLGEQRERGGRAGPTLDCISPSSFFCSSFWLD